MFFSIEHLHGELDQYSFNQMINKAMLKLSHLTSAEELSSITEATKEIIHKYQQLSAQQKEVVKPALQNLKRSLLEKEIELSARMVKDHKEESL